MMKKIMLTTALASSMLFAATYANAEAKMSGTLEATLGSGETPSTTTKTNQGTTIGWEANLSVSGTKELDSGLTMAMGANIESESTTSIFDAPYMTFTSGNTTFGLAQDTVFTIDDSTIVPSVDGNNIEDANKGLGISFKHNGITIHDSNLMGISHKTDFGTLQVAYSPKVDDKSMGNDSAPSAVTKSGSGTAIGFKGSLGIEGLNAVAYTNKRSTSGLDAQEISSNSIGATYNFGSFKVGAQRTSYDDVAGTALTTFSSGASADADSYGVSFAATDQLSLGINYAELSGTSVTKDEETTSVTAGYDLGGALLSLRYTEVQNKAGTANNDGEAVELRIKQAF